jgi:hypothetical protein
VVVSGMKRSGSIPRVGPASYLTVYMLHHSQPVPHTLHIEKNSRTIGTTVTVSQRHNAGQFFVLAAFAVVKAYTVCISRYLRRRSVIMEGFRTYPSFGFFLSP